MSVVTIKDVAEKAHVSVYTVSRVLNKRGYISQETYNKVNAAIEELNYSPNQLARSLFRQKTNIIGLIIPDVSHPFFAELTKQIEKYLYQRNFKMLLCNTVGESHRERDYIHMLRQNKVDGIIIGSHTLELEEYEKLDLPIVSLDMDLGSNIPSVGSDHTMGGSLAAEELIRCGCQRVVQVMGDKRVRTPSHMRHYAFLEKLEANNVHCETIELREGEFDPDNYSDVIKETLRKYPDLDGFFAVDLIAANFIKIASEHGQCIPEQIKVVGYDGINIAKLYNPQISTIIQPINAIAKTAVEKLDNLINKKPVSNFKEVLPVTFQIGRTT